MSSTSFAHQNWFSGQEVAVGNMLKIQIVGLIIFFFAITPVLSGAQAKMTLCLIAIVTYCSWQ